MSILMNSSLAALILMSSIFTPIDIQNYENLTAATGSLSIEATDLWTNPAFPESLPSSYAGSEFIVAYYCLDHDDDFRIDTHTYYSSCLSPYYIQCLDSSFAFSIPRTLLNEHDYPSSNYIDYKCTLMTSDPHNGWEIAGLFKQTTSGVPILGETPSGSSPLYSVEKILYSSNGSPIGYFDVTNNASSYFAYRIAQLGDINGDGNVGLQDAVAISQALNGGTGLNAQKRLAADVNGDQQLNSNDINLILNYLAGNITSFLDNWLYYGIDVNEVGGNEIS